MLALLGGVTGANAQTAARPGGAAPAAGAAGAGGAPGAEVPYDKWTATAHKQAGLFTVWRKDGKVYLELRADQFDKDYLETAVPANGLGGYGVVSGQVFQQEARLVRFSRDEKRVALVWPQTHFDAKPGTAEVEAVRLSTAASVMGMAPIVTEDKKNDLVVLDMSVLLGDVADLTQTINRRLSDPKDPTSQFRLDPTRSYFGPSKAFPQNVVIEADQTFTSLKPLEAIDTVVDPRSIQMRVTYNLLALPENDDYMPRLYDDRVGYFEDAHIMFGAAPSVDNYAHYISRWNMQPSDPSKPLSPAKHPMVYTLSNTIPVEYRDPIRRGILEWNKAFAKIGISDAVKVVEQPADPNWDPDDFRYNVVRWLTEANSGGFAEAQPVWDPRTGEVFRTGVLIDADLMRFTMLAADARFGGNTDEAPAAGAHERSSLVHNDGVGANAQMGFGAFALALMSGGDPQAIARKNAADYLFSITLHESGHNFGLQHNFIGHEGYSIRELRDKGFTDRYGLSASVMDYIPFNLAPKGAKNGELFQLVLGPYDYHAIQYGYAAIPGAKTPQDELPTLRRWASVWTDPRYRFASDEDVAWYSGHAVDPRVNQFLLSNDELGWCSEQLGIVHGLLQNIDRRFPKPGAQWLDERAAFGYMLSPYVRCASNASHYVGGEYLSRARVGDPNAGPPLTAVPRAQERRAFAMVDRYLLSNEAWNFSPQTLRRLVYSEHSSFGNFGGTYFPRHDISVADLAARWQDVALGYMFNPLVLSRLADLPTKAAPGSTMTLADLFAWTQSAVYGDLSTGKIANASAVRRNLQRRYAARLGRLATTPDPGTPYDAQSLARYELVDLAGRIGTALHGARDVQTKAHLEAMRSDVRRFLTARRTITS
ncbi:MAG: zinc-dependent metalloprotease [Candidatus Eremiobacteraeota bacterium]|nr:zinc-dependent metalloprotease [Candidatus Eremiobacteraeota bacterium]